MVYWAIRLNGRTLLSKSDASNYLCACNCFAIVVSAADTTDDNNTFFYLLSSSFYYHNYCCCYFCFCQLCCIFYILPSRLISPYLSPFLLFLSCYLLAPNVFIICLITNPTRRVSLSVSPTKKVHTMVTNIHIIFTICSRNCPCVNYYYYYYFLYCFMTLLFVCALV